METVNPKVETDFSKTHCAPNINEEWKASQINDNPGGGWMWMLLTQIVMWIFIAVAIPKILQGKLLDDLFDFLSFVLGGILAVLSYFFSIIIHCKSPEFGYLGNKVGDKEISEIMLQYIKAAPKITLKTESYHMSGKKKKVTIQEEEEFVYNSFKDISGLFRLSIPEKSTIKYIRLEILNDINFADSITYSDYCDQKKALYNKKKIKIN